MPIAIAADAGWKRPTVGPGLEDFAAGDARAPGSVAAGGPTDAALPVSTGNTARIALEAPEPLEPAPAPAAPEVLRRADLLGLLAAMVGLLASMTGLVAKLFEQRGLKPAAAA